jgi:hypothetical protein
LKGTLSGGRNWAGFGYVLNSSTVLDDRAVDVLVGGLHLDWAWVMPGDMFMDRHNGGMEWIN